MHRVKTQPLARKQMLITKTRLFGSIEKFTTKSWKFSDKNSDSLRVPAEAVLKSTPNLRFWAEIRKIMYTPVNLNFTI